MKNKLEAIKKAINKWIELNKLIPTLPIAYLTDIKVPELTGIIYNELIREKSMWHLKHIQNTGGLMNEKYVCCLETSKKLKGVGYKQEGEFWWYHQYLPETKSDSYAVLSYEVYDGWFRDEYGELLAVAPSANELLDRLPDSIFHDKRMYALTLSKNPANYYEVDYINFGRQHAYLSSIKVEISSNNVCETLASLYVYLTTHNLLKAYPEV